MLQWLLDMISAPMLLSLVLGSVTMGIAQANGLNLWPGVALSAYVLAGIVCFQWAANRYSDRAVALRILMGALYGSVPILSVPVILGMTAAGWEPSVELIRELPWGMPPPEKDVRVRDMLEASIGPTRKEETPLNLLEGAIRRAVAAIPELADRERAVTTLQSQGPLSVVPLLQQLKMGSLIPAALLPPQQGTPVPGSNQPPTPQGA